MTERYPIRPISPDEFDAFHLVDEHAFHDGPLPAGKRPKVLSRFEFDRSLAAFDGSTPVGIAGAFSFRMRLPGALGPGGRGELGRRAPVLPPPGHPDADHAPAAGRHQGPGRGAGRAVGVRGGRSTAGTATAARPGTTRSPSGAARGRWPRTRPPTPGCGCGSPSPKRSRAELAKVYDTVLETRPGFFARNDVWWNRILDDPETTGRTPPRCGACWPRTMPARAATRSTPASAGGTTTCSCPTASSTSGNWSPPTRPPAPRCGPTC